MSNVDKATDPHNSHNSHNPYALLERAGQADYIGESVSQLDHALQAAHFARAAGARTELVLAALFHDIGHLIPGDHPRMDALGTLDHESLGADLLLGAGFPADVAELVRGHVQAKRYLVSQKSYPLSEASRGTLAFQGGPMTAAEAAAFERDPLFREKIQLRKFDEAAKRVGFSVPALATYRDLFQLCSQNASATALRSPPAMA